MKVNFKVEKLFDSWDDFIHCVDREKVDPFLQYAVNTIMYEAERLAPERKSDYPPSRDRSRGRLKRSLRAGPWKTIPTGELFIAAQDVKREDTYYARWVEKGAQAHTIGKHSRVRSNRKIGTMHPGTKATHFFQQAVRNKRREARQIIEDGIFNNIRQVPTR